MFYLVVILVWFRAFIVVLTHLSIVTLLPFQFHRRSALTPRSPLAQQLLLLPVYSVAVSTPKRKRLRETEKTWENFRLPESVEPAEERSWKRHKHLKLAKRRTSSSQNASSLGANPIVSTNKCLCSQQFTVMFLVMDFSLRRWWCRCLFSHLNLKAICWYFVDKISRDYWGLFSTASQIDIRPYVLTKEIQK